MLGYFVTYGLGYVCGVISGIVASSVYDSWDKIKSVNESISSTEKSWMTNTFNTVVAVCQIKLDEWHYKYVKLLKHTTPVNKDFHDVEYYHNNTKHRIRIRASDRNNIFSRFITFFDVNGNDITHLIAPYAGPSCDFHGLTYYPSDFGYSELSMVDDNDKICVFKSGDKITLC